MRNGITLTQRIIAKQPRLNTIAGPQTISFRKIKRNHWAKTAAQAHIQILCPPVDKLVTDNEKNEKNQLSGLWKISFKI